MATRLSYRHGRIVWALLRNSQTGKRERHPAIILDRDDEIVQPEHFDPRRPGIGDNVVHVIGVSTKHKFYDTPYVELPFSSAGHSVSGLKQDCGAIIGWYDRLSIPDDIIGFGGDVPAAQMALIDRSVRDDLKSKLGLEINQIGQMLDELLGD